MAGIRSGPKHVVTKGATPVLSPAEARRLLEAINTGTLAGLRDRALVSVMLYSFARVSAVIAMRKQDYFRQESRGWLRLHEKGGKRHDVPAHHRAAEALDDYLEAADLEEAKAALFQSVDPAGRRLTGRALSRRLVLAMIKRRAVAADLPPSYLLPHVPGDGDHGVSVERGDARARAADRRARVAEDDEALRPAGRHDHRRRDRAHRDLNQADPLDGLEPSLRPPTLTVGILRLRPSPVEEPGRGIERGNGWRNTLMPAGTQERTRTRGRHKTTEQTSAETPPGSDGG